MGSTLQNDSIDYELFATVLGPSVPTAAIHNRTASISDLIEVPKSLQPATPLDLWYKYYRPPLEKDGLLSEADYETKYFPDTETLEDFVNANRNSLEIASNQLNVVDTTKYKSKQDACSKIDNCCGWWQFSRIGYNADKTEALVHADYEHPKRTLMGSGYFVLLNRAAEGWNVIARDMTWIS